ncbi:hypothetical protein HMPREF9946_02176, partial [Acetobacteraceae bacterium AT-5844]
RSKEHSAAGQIPAPPDNLERPMDTLLEGMVALACAVISAAVPVLLPGLVTQIRANVHDKRVALIAEAAARAAGRIVVSVAGQAPSSGVQAAMRSALNAEVATLKRQLPETIAKVGASDATLTQMVQGELGKLLGQKEVAPLAVPPALRELVMGGSTAGNPVPPVQSWAGQGS